MLPEGIVFGDQHRALEVLRNARVGDPDLVMTQRLAGLRGFALAQLRERGPFRIRFRERANVGQCQVDVREKHECERGERAGDSYELANDSARRGSDISLPPRS